jgi:hypothetical protein
MGMKRRQDENGGAMAHRPEAVTLPSPGGRGELQALTPGTDRRLVAPGGRGELQALTLPSPKGRGELKALTLALSRRERGLSRRAFLTGGTLLVAGGAAMTAEGLLAATEEKPKIRVGLVTDLHYADKPAGGTRHYRQSRTKLAEAVAQFKKERAEFVAHLGDAIDTAPELEAEKGYLRQVVRDFSASGLKHHFVVGNHCVASLTKPEFLEIAGQERSYYSFDAGGYHFVVLDACFRGDGKPYGRRNFDWGDAWLPPAELQWLKDDLRQSPLRSIVMVHQCLDLLPPLGIKNAPEVRKILEQSGKVLAVLQGHFHFGNYSCLGGLHYCTLSAAVEGAGAENNAYAMLDLLPGDVVKITGFRKQKSYRC